MREKLAKFNGVYIPSIDAKDIYLSNNYIADKGVGYSLYKRGGELNINRFINTLDYSLELIKLKEVYYSISRKLRGFTESINDKEYTKKIINVTFKYSSKEWNKYGENLYVKFGYDLKELEFTDCVCIHNGTLAAIKVDTKVKEPVSNIGTLDRAFYYSEKDQEYKQRGSLKMVKSVAELREDLYENGFLCDGVKYIRYKRSSGSSRVGKCLFIDESLYEKMHEWELCGLTVERGQNLDLAAFESYISLTLSSIIGTIEIQKENILVIDDWDSIFNDDVMVTRIENDTLVTREENIAVKNSIWDGQSLADESLFGKYKHYGMMLLRNRFFKSACFNTNMQRWFADNGITEISQLNGRTLAAEIKDIKLITTPNSIKYLKFDTLDKWLDNLDTTFGLVKHEKPTHYFNGRMVQMHYQLLNSLNMTHEEVEALVKPDLDYLNLIKSDPVALRYHLKYPHDDEFEPEELKTQNEIIFKLLGLNEKFYQTNLCRRFIRDLVQSYYKNLRCGHILINGTYATLFGNPMEMLKAAIGTFDGSSEMSPESVMTMFYQNGETIVGSRSPHISFSNVLMSTNVYNDNISKYFNLTKEIICVNSINENILNRLSGSDYDSDSLLITNNEILVNAGRRSYGRFKVPVSEVNAEKISRKYNQSQKADLDIKTSVNMIGEIINFSQELNSKFWDNIANGTSYEDNLELYSDICQLDIMSRLEIDSAKKEFSISNKKELGKIKDKYHGEDYCVPKFFEVLSEIKRPKKHKARNKLYREYDTPMDYLQSIISKYKLKNFKGRPLKFHEILNFSGIDQQKYNSRHMKEIKDTIQECDFYVRDMWSGNNRIEPFDRYMLCLDKKKEMVDRINTIELNKHTIAHILKSVEYKEYKSIAHRMLYLLFNYKNKEFYDLLIDSLDDSAYLIEDENGPIQAFGIKFSTKNP